MPTKQKTDKELIQEFLGTPDSLLERVWHVLPLPTDRRSGRKYRVTFKDNSSAVYRVYFAEDGDGNQFVKEME